MEASLHAIKTISVFVPIARVGTNCFTVLEHFQAIAEFLNIQRWFYELRVVSSSSLLPLAGPPPILPLSDSLSAPEPALLDVDGLSMLSSFMCCNESPTNELFDEFDSFLSFLCFSLYSVIITVTLSTVMFMEVAFLRSTFLNFDLMVFTGLGGLGGFSAFDAAF